MALTPWKILPLKFVASLMLRAYAHDSRHHLPYPHKPLFCPPPFDEGLLGLPVCWIRMLLLHWIIILLLLGFWYFFCFLDMNPTSSSGVIDCVYLGMKLKLIWMNGKIL